MSQQEQIDRPLGQCSDTSGCCRELSRVWTALGITEYNGKSASENVAALRAQQAEGGQTRIESAQDVEEKIYHAYEAARRLQQKHVMEHADFEVMLIGIRAARRFVFNSYQASPLPTPAARKEEGPQ